MYFTGKEVRAACRRGEITGCTSGLAKGYEQANLVVLPKTLALSFVTFCVRNKKSCPLLEVTNPGCPTSNLLGDLDIRTDLPKYRVHRGEEFEEVTDIKDLWTAESVAILLGCSFTFEDVFVTKGIPVRHMEEGVNVPMYVTNRLTVPSGPFHGPLVVSMRPIPSKLVSEAKEITSRFPSSHGTPVHIGDPAAIGIMDLGEPDFGDSVTIKTDEVPMFWACGVTSQLAFEGIEDIEWISHAPGCMLVTDRESSYID